MADPRLKQLMIKTGVVRRLAKEKVSYEKEANTQKVRIERLKNEGQDDHVLKKEEEVLQESFMMVPDCQRRYLCKMTRKTKDMTHSFSFFYIYRLAKAFEELSQFLKNETELHETEEYSKAEVVLEEARPHLPQSQQ